MPEGDKPHRYEKPPGGASANENSVPYIGLQHKLRCIDLLKRRRRLARPMGPRAIPEFP